MADTWIHKLYGKWKNGKLKKVPPSLQMQWDRHNFDWDEFRAERKKKKEKIADKDMLNQLQNDTRRED